MLSHHQIKQALEQNLVTTIYYTVIHSYVSKSGFRVYQTIFLAETKNGEVSPITRGISELSGARLLKWGGISTTMHPRELISTLASKLGVTPWHIQETEN